MVLLCKTIWDRTSGRDDVVPEQTQPQQFISYMCIYIILGVSPDVSWVGG